MIQLSLSAGLFFLCQFTLGYYLFAWANQKRDIMPVSATCWFFIGLVVNTIYFSIVSLWLPLNHRVLVPHVLLLIHFFATPSYGRLLLGQRLQWLVKPQQLPWVIGLSICLITYWVAPPIHGDSRGYHILSVKWYHDYAVVPGLANLHGRFAFNPALFVLSAPFCFTEWTGQPLYPANGVLVWVFGCWFLKKTMEETALFRQIILLAFFLAMLRQLLVGISSPAPDGLAIVFAAYVLLDIFFHLSKRDGNKLRLHQIVFMVFAPLAKLSLLPLLLLYPVLVFPVQRGRKAIAGFTLLLIVCWTPWLIRNYYLSGYLLYPVWQTGFLHPDWQAPKEILLVDYAFIKFGGRLAVENITAQITGGNLQMTQKWFLDHFARGRWLEVILLLAAMLSWIPWLGVKRGSQISRSLLMLWLVCYCSCIWWIITCPEYRFGVVYLSMAAGLPWLTIFNSPRRAVANLSARWWLGLSLGIVGVVYAVRIKGYDHYYRAPLSEFWLKPLPIKLNMVKGEVLTPNCYQTDFGVTIYQSEGFNYCVEAPLPCAPWPYGTLATRTGKIQDGFRLKENRVASYFPFVLLLTANGSSK